MAERISFINWIQKEQKVGEDWLKITKRLEGQISSLVESFSLPELGKVFPCNSNSDLQIKDLGKVLTINSEEITLRTQGIYDILYFDGVVDRSEIRTRYLFGYTADHKWLCIAVTYHESDEGTPYQCIIDKVDVSEIELQHLLELTPYPYVIWYKLEKVVDEWYRKSKERFKKVKEVRRDFKLVRKLTNLV